MWQALRSCTGALPVPVPQPWLLLVRSITARWRRVGLLAGLLLSLVANAQPGTSPPSGPPPTLPAPGGPQAATPPPSTIQELGQQRYRVGAIEVDRQQRRFTVPGVVLRLDSPLEFLAVTKGGLKRYESLLELETNAIDFNLACILIGLDVERSRLPRHHFDREPAQGDPVDIQVSWQIDGKPVQVKAAELFKEGEQVVTAHEWVYTGSRFLPDGRYLAEQTGSLLSFVHDPESIIQHRQGLGLGNYGSVGVNRTVAPPVGTPITVSIQRR